MLDEKSKRMRAMLDRLAITPKGEAMNEIKNGEALTADQAATKIEAPKVPNYVGKWITVNCTCLACKPNGYFRAFVTKQNGANLTTVELNKDGNRMDEIRRSIGEDSIFGGDIRGAFIDDNAARDLIQTVRNAPATENAIADRGQVGMCCDIALAIAERIDAEAREVIGISTKNFARATRLERQVENQIETITAIQKERDRLLDSHVSKDKRIRELEEALAVRDTPASQWGADALAKVLGGVIVSDPIYISMDEARQAGFVPDEEPVSAPSPQCQFVGMDNYENGSGATFTFKIAGKTVDIDIDVSDGDTL